MTRMTATVSVDHDVVFVAILALMAVRFATFAVALVNPVGMQLTKKDAMNARINKIANCGVLVRLSVVAIVRIAGVVFTTTVKSVTLIKQQKTA